MGVGYPRKMRHSPGYTTGASLKMWRDFFPQAQIYGADIAPQAMFKDKRIKTFLCDETKEENLKNLIEQTGSDIDLFIDDASHDKQHQVFLAKTILPLLKDGVIYIIEDAWSPDFIAQALASEGYEATVPEEYKTIRNPVGSNLMMVKKAKKINLKAEIPGETPLCRLAYQYQTDKCPRIRHNYTPYYYRLFKNKRQTIKKVLEIGIGLKNGASLRMWQDFFPQAQIYGADHNPLTMVQGRRIKSFLCDSTKTSDIKDLVKKVGPDVDFFVDDGSHVEADQVFLAKTILPLLKNEVIYIIEDVYEPDYVKANLKDYHCQVIKFSERKSDKLVIISEKIKGNKP
jgi:trans-aconitate methyltransferase